MNYKFTVSKKIIALLFILLAAIIIRFWQLGNIPPSPDWDEAALGYNAYSIMQTGKDEYGKFMPVVLRSFDDYKPALYAYLVIPSIQIFGFNTFAVRFPAAFFGVLAVLATYFLVEELTGNDVLSFFSSLLLAISPWHIQFTRVAFESSVGMSFNLFAALFFLKGLKKPLFLFFSVIFISLSLYVYQSEKIFSPLFFLSLTIIYRKKLFALSKFYIISGVILGLLITFPLVMFTFTNKNALARAQGVSFLSEETSFLSSDAARLIRDKANNDKLGILLDNRRIIFTKTVIANYLSHFDLNWLFITGDISRHHAPGMGLLYLFEIPFLLVGIYLIFFGEFEKETKKFLIVWILLTPIPASVTTGVPHAVRTLNFLPTFQILTAIGIIAFFAYIKYLKERYLKYGILVLFSFFAIFNIAYFLDQYFVQQNYFNSVDWQYGYSKIVPVVKNLERKYKKIVVSNSPYMDQSYMFFLFYLKYSPLNYQKQGVYASGGFRENHAYGKYEFRPIQWEREVKSSDVLYVGRSEDFPPGAKKLYQVNFLNGTPGMEIIEG